MTTPPSSSSSQPQFTYSNAPYFPVPFHLQQPATTSHYAAPYVATPAVQLPQPPIVGPVPPPAAYSVPQYQVSFFFLLSFSIGKIEFDINLI